MSFLSVSIVFYMPTQKQVKSVIKSCLSSRLVQKIYVIDNSPTKQIEDWIEYNKVIEYLHFPENLGFGKAHNIAFAKSMKENYSYHAIVNPDVTFSVGVFEELVSFLEKNKNVGATMPNILYPNGEIQWLCKLYPTPFNLLFRRFMPSKQFKEKLDYTYEMKFLNQGVISKVPLLSGCFLLLRTEVFQNGCFFDDRYFMYLEDYDLCRLIRNAGWELCFYPKVSVYHEFEKGSHKSWKLLIIHIKSAISYFNKWGWFIDQERKRVNHKYK